MPFLTSRRQISIYLVVFLAIQAVLGTYIPGMASRDRLDLVRIEVGSTEDLSLLEAVGIDVYARLFTDVGNLVLVAGVDARQQEILRRAGYHLEVLEQDQSGSGYYLLYGLPEDFIQVQEEVPLLIVEGRQAVAALQPAQKTLLVDLGIDFKPIHPQAFIAVERSSASVQALSNVLQPDPLVQEMINQVSASAITSLVGEMSGEWPVNIEGAPFLLSTRYTPADTYIHKATRYAYEHLAQAGLSVGYHNYKLYGVDKQNVYAWQTGVAQPNHEFLIIAHLDSYSMGSPYSLAPGADDNASGSAGLLAAANILQQYAFGCTLRYVLFTGEEQGMVGSSAFVPSLLDTPGIQVGGVLNLDMIAYNTLNSAPTLELHVRTGNANDLQIASLFQEVVSAYGLNLSTKIIQPGNTFSDHSSFWNYGIPAILAIEDWTDHTPYYHQPSDQLESLNIPYFTEFTKAAVGTLAHMGCLLEEGVLRGTVKEFTSGVPIAGANVIASLDPSHSWTTLTQTDGTFQLLVSPGDYTIDVTNPYYLSAEIQDVSVLRAKETSLKVGLTPCENGVSFTSFPNLPNVGQAVTFTAGASGLPPSDYQWDFGDGSAGSGQIVTHAFAAPGLYTVSLEILSLCPGTIVQHTVPIQITMHYFPLVIIPTR